jgi:hypothetical protein
MEIFKSMDCFVKSPLPTITCEGRNQNISWFLIQGDFEWSARRNDGIRPERNHMNVAVLRHLEMIDRSLMDSRPTFAAKEQAHTQGAWLAPVNQ